MIFFLNLIVKLLNLRTDKNVLLLFIFNQFFPTSGYHIMKNKNQYKFIIQTLNSRMDHLKEILMRKAKFIAELKHLQYSNLNAFLNYLKQIKKQEKESEKNDIKLLKSLPDDHYDLKQFFQYVFSQQRKVYFLSFAVMKSMCKKFQFLPEEKQSFANIVEMHYRFYVKEGALDKAEEIRLAFRKKSLEKVGFLFIKKYFVIYLLNCLYSWSKNKLDKLLNKNIVSIEKDLLTEKLQSHTKFTQNHQKLLQNSAIKDFMFEGTSIDISFCQKLCKTQKIQKKQNLKIEMNEKSNLLINKKPTLNIGSFLNHQITQEAQIIMEKSFERVETSFGPEKSNELVVCQQLLKHRSKSYNRDYHEKNQLSYNLNKEIFYGAYWKQMQQLYRNLNILDDLDSYYLKTFKKQKQEKKEQLVKKKIDKIVEFMIKNMPKIKKSVENYDIEYAKYCPKDIKEFHTDSSKILQGQNKKQVKNVCLKKIDRIQVHQQIKLHEKFNSQENSVLTDSPQSIYKKNSLFRNKQRNKSLNDVLLRKQTQQKVQMQVKLPIVYNPEHLYNMAESDTQKASAIHQKFQKFLMNGPRPNKGLARYKLMNKEREKNVSDSTDFMDDKVRVNQNLFKDNRKQHEYEVANIRKILKKRQKERLFANKTPTHQINKEEEIVDNIMIHIKAMQTKYVNEAGARKKVQKLDFFLNSFKNNQSSPFSLKTNMMSSNFWPGKNNQLQINQQYKVFKQDFLPKIL